MGIVRKSEIQAFAVDFLADTVLAVFAVGAWDEDAKEWVGQPNSDTQTFNYAALSKEDAKKYNDVLGAVTAKALKDREGAKAIIAALQATTVQATEQLEAKKTAFDNAQVIHGQELTRLRTKVSSLENDVQFYRGAYNRADAMLLKARSRKSRLTFGLWT